MKLNSAKLLLLAANFAVLSPSAWGSGKDEAVGKPGKASEVTRTVTVQMLDSMRFQPDTIAVKQGETIRLIVVNKGDLPHELVLGSMHELKEHAAQMRTNPHAKHEDEDEGEVEVHVEPKQQKELVWKFTRAGTVDFACLLPGHFEAGMIGKVQVKKR